ncbi:MAG: coproporphyrinogen III oxidase, partial [bacterium]|nr:coproporphyrinogen III oxidase [bacterium]
GGDRYGAAYVPEEGAIVEFYEQAVERLAAMGVRRYEISNFARPGRESLHNLKYWRLQPYAGFGADAHSFDGAVRRADAMRCENFGTAAEYVERWRAGQSVVAEQTEARLAEEHFFVGLRLSEGIEPAPEEWRRFGPIISRFIASGLLEGDSRRLRLTDRGILVSNEVFQEFLDL